MDNILIDIGRIQIYLMVNLSKLFLNLWNCKRFFFFFLLEIITNFRFKTIINM